MKHFHHPYRWLIALLLFVGLVVLGAVPMATNAAPTPQEVVQNAWHLAQQSGRYHYRSLVDQTVYPAPAVQNAGRPPSESHLAVEGEIDIPGETMAMTLWNDGSFNPQTGLSVKLENGITYGRQGQGAWQEMDNVADAFAPGGDPLSFLAGATNVQAAGPERREFDGLTLNYNTYTFDLNGRLLGEYLIAQTDRYQEKYGPLPEGMTLQTPESYQRMTGTGEIWLNEAGLPAHLRLEIAVPDQPKKGERATAVLSTDYSRFDLSQLSLATTPFASNPKGWLTYHVPHMVTAVQTQIPFLLILFLVSGLGIMSLRYWQHRRFYQATAAFLITAMLASPLLQGEYAHAFSERVATDQQAHETQQNEAEQRQALQTAAQDLNTHWDPHQNPYTAGKNQTPANTPPQSSTEQGQTFVPQNEGNRLTSTTDSDNDGLTDDLEAYWGTCAYLVGSSGYNNSSYCDNVPDPTDSDGDGLSDDAEVTYLNTYPTSVDTDGDSITDTIEVEGFVYNGRTWYLNPNSSDTNGDGQPDNSECNLFLAGTLDLTTACGDTNGNGIPDFMDPDNDGDQIPDSEDLSPMNASPETYDRNNPFLLTLNNLEVDQPVLVDIQIRPQSDDHLQYYNLVLDWPLDDSGQIQRHLDTTWADTANPDYRSDADNAANGDIRLVPMLEVTMPYSAGHYANLPVNSTYHGTSRPAGTAVEEWLDTSVTQPFGMAVDDVAGTEGDLVAYVPLYPVTTDEGTSVGYTTRLIYQPSQANWGEAHRYRVLWLVQMLTDECIDPHADEATCARQDTITIIHTYHEAWQLTGLTVSEEYGLDVGLMYENPSSDTHLNTDDQLWGASWNLGNNFFRGRDCDTYVDGSCVSDGQRDVTIANLGSKLADWNLDYTELETFSYPHQGYMAQIMMTETTSILDTVFTPYASQTVPTILIAQEQNSRITNLDALSTNATGDLVVDMGTAVVPLQTLVSLSWSSYQYSNGAWQNYDSEAYLDYLAQQLALQPSFQPTDSSQDAQDEADGKVLWAQMYYAAILQGGKAVVQVDTTVLSRTSRNIPETNYDDVIPVNIEWGISQIATEYAVFYLNKRFSTVADAEQFSFFKKLTSGASEGPQFTHLNQGGGSAMSMMVIGMAVLGIALIAAGLATGNESLVRDGVIIMAIATLIVVSYYIVLAVVALYTAVSATGSIILAVLVGKVFQGVGVVGFIIGTIISWAITGILIAANGIHGAALGFTLSMSIAGTIVLFIYLILDLIGLGLVVLILIWLDALFAILNKPGPTQLLTEAIAQTLYGIDVLVQNMDDANRLDLNITGFTLADEELGFTVDNSFLYSVTVSNTVQYDDGFSFSTLEDRTVFRYFLEDEPLDHHSGLTQGEMVGEWVNLPDALIESVYGPGGLMNLYANEARTTQFLNITVPLSNIGTGIDQSMDGELFVTESYILPYRGCWQFAGQNTDCRWYKVDGSSHVNLGEELIYDVLPTALSSFVAMKWDERLPAQVDGDNDGLLATDGNDPDNRAFDSDGDGLSDYYEIIHGLDAYKPDPDFDGLNDAEELNDHTNPFNADSDGDGLNDYVEVKQGWLVVYKNDGVSKLTRVWSDPNQPDADDDTLNDREEFVFGFHPQITSDRSAILDLVQFNNLDVAEDTDLRLLYRMEEPLESEAFFDSSGSGNLGSCDRSTNACPTAEVNGRYGYAFSFDGNDKIHTDMALDVTAFTTGAWVYPVPNDNGFHSLMGEQATSSQKRAPSVYVTQQTKIHGGFGDGTTWNSITTGNVLTLNTWQYVATTFDGTTYRVYVNGTEVFNTVAFAGKKPYPTTGYNIGYVDNYFKGRLDEVAFLDRALTATEITALMNGRYNPNDDILAPGNDLTYQATVTNTSSVTVSGFLVADTTYHEPEVAQPLAAFSFEPKQRLAYFVNSQGEENSAFCVDEGTCPSAGLNGQIKNAIDFDGVNDFLTAPMLDVDNPGFFNLSFWLKADTLPASGQKAMILDTASTETGAVDIYLNSSGKLVMDIVGDPYSPRISNYTFGTSWTHVSYAPYYALYINGTLNTSTNVWIVPSTGTAYGDFKFGYGRLGNNLAGTQPFDGKLDEFVFYHNRSTSGITDIRDGNYNTYGAPNILYRFDELINYDGTIFYDSQTASNHATCSGATCPILTLNGAGFIKRAVTFDGVNDYLTQPGNFTAAETTVTLYVKPTNYPTAGNVAYLYDTQAVGSGTTFTFDLYMDQSGKLTVNYGAGSKTYNTAVPLNAWNKIEVVYVRFFNSTWRYQIQLKVNGVLDGVVADVCTNPGGACVSTARVGSGRIGNNLAGTAPFHGLLDELNLQISKISFDPPLTNLGYENLANDVRSATCSDVFICPSVVTGKFDQGVGFDGVQTFLDLGPIVDPSAGNFSAAVWFKASTVGNQPVLLQQTDGTGAAGREWLGLNTNGTLKSFLGNSTLNGTTAVTPNTWHHAALTYDGVTLRLYLDGALEAESVRTLEASDGSLWLGRHKSDTSRYFSGTMDELLVLPTAVTPAAVQLLMNSTWPIIDVPALFEPFTTTPLTTQEVRGTAVISPHAVTSVHQFDQEVEAALVNTLDYPVIDDNASNLSVFVPFEDTPGTTIFDNLISYPNPNNVNPNVEALCSGNSCPTAGLRGQVDRAAYFDGLDDYLLIDVSDGGYYSWGPDFHSIAVWVNAKQGTILDIGYDTGDFQVDMNQFFTDQGTAHTTAYNLPRNEWFHLAITVDGSDVSRVYINGVQITTGTNDYMDRPKWIYIGGNHAGQDFLQGYLDDLRTYKTTLSAADVLSLYQKSAPLMRFEFDEDGEASVFTDNSVHQYLGQPKVETCTKLDLNNLLVNNLATDPSTVFVALDGEWIHSTTDLSSGAVITPQVSTVLCEQQTLSVGVTTDSSTTTLGTAVLNATTPGTLNQTFTSGGDAITLNWTVNDTLTYQPNPAPGIKGRIGNGALFDGNGYIEVPNAGSVAALTNNFTIMAWIYPEDLNGWQYFLTNSIQNSTNGYGFLARDHDLGFATLGIKSYYIPNVLKNNVWQHVAVVFDTGNDATFYLNGVNIGKVNGTLPATANLDDLLMIGSTRIAAGTLGAPPFKGTIDEIALYGRTLSTAEINSLYLRELRWYRDRATHYLTVDTDAPTVELLSDTPYRANGYTQLAVATTDPTSYVTLLDVGLKGPADSAFRWAGALACQDNGIEGAAWCPYFDTSTLGGEGKYEMQFRAVDAVGNQTLSPIYTFYVDNTAPTASGNYSGQWGTPIAQDDSGLRWTMALSGTVNDPNLATTPAVAGSGVVTNSVLITLIDETGGLLGEEGQLATVNGSAWSINYQMEGARPQGTYTVTVHLADQVGNQASLDLGTIRYDERPSQANLNDWELGGGVISDTTTLSGTVSDQANWGGEAIQLHFEEAPGATTFYDASGEGNHGSCINCPVSIAGFYGQAVHFDGVNDAITLTNVVNPISNTFSIALWVKADSAGSGLRGLLSQQDGTGLGRAVLYLDGSNRLTSSLGGVTSTAVTPLASNTWHHVALTFDGTTLAFYLDGLLDGTATVTPEAANGGLVLGIAKDLVSTPFRGDMDEVVIYRRTLNQLEVSALAQPNSSGVQSVQVAVEPFDFSGNSFTNTPTRSPNWQSATINNAQWHYDLPNQPEGFYNIFLRSTDNFGNTQDERVVWRGLIDTVYPTVVASGHQIGGGTAAETEYTFTFSDFLLDEASYVQPCDAGSLVSLRTNDPSLPYDGYPYQVTATCRVSGHETSRAFEACDTIGHCLNLTVTPTPTTNDSNVVITTPAESANLTSTIPISITGGAYDLDGIQRLTVRVVNTVIDTIVPAPNTTDTLWSSNWIPPTAGTYTITVTMTDTLGNATSDAVHVTAVGTAPTAVADTYNTSEDVPLFVAAPGVLGNDSDPDNHPLTAVLNTTVATGTLALAFSGAFTYTPPADWFGTTVFTYHAKDGQINSNVVTVTLTVNSVNDVPIVASDSYTTSEDVALSVALPGVLSNDSDADGDGLTAVLNTTVTTGTLTLASSGAFTYTPPANWFGTTTFTYHATDGQADSNAVTVMLTINAVNDAPVAVGNGYITAEDTLLSVALPGVLANDSDGDGDGLTAVLNTTVTTGTLTLASSGAFTYTPPANWFGTTAFTYHANDGQADSNVVTVTLTVLSVNDAPVVNAGADATAVEGDLVSLTGSYIDPGQRLLADTIHWDFGDGSVISGTLTPSHAYGDNGTFTVTLTITDSAGGVGTDWLVVAVSNAAPTVTAVADLTTTVGTVISFTTPYTDAGWLDSHTATIAWGDTLTEPGTLANNTVSGHHAYNNAGVYTVTITLNDDDNATAVQTFTVTVASTGYAIFLPVGVRH